MTPARLRECLGLLGWNAQQLADATGYARGTVRQWRDGRARVPWPVQDWLEAAATWHEKNPIPERKDKEMPASSKPRLTAQQRDALARIVAKPGHVMPMQLGSIGTTLKRRGLVRVDWGAPNGIRETMVFYATPEGEAALA